MPATEWGWQITPQELEGWIMERRGDVLVVNKPPSVVCHPSRHGPWSSLVGACKEYLGVERLHMPMRLDRETSGLMLLAYSHDAGSRLQRAMFRGRVRKTYLAILDGTLDRAVTVDQPVGPAAGAAFFQRQAVVTEGGRAAVTEFVPLRTEGGYTLAEVHPLTGRRHQIRVHAAWLGLPLLGDKLYGRDDSLMLEFMQTGYSPEFEAKLAFRRQALHAAEAVFRTELGEEVYRAPLASDMAEFPFTPRR
ncbi:MAG TPA: RNA pseudouridine synthase [Solibacterales bacterium]|nr:RNA pseudouridine synthase [Bryobacterales bacterium]